MCSNEQDSLGKDGTTGAGGWCRRVPARHVIMGVLAFKLVLVTYIGAMSSLTVVAMVRPRNASNASAGGDCPAPLAPVNASGPPDGQSGEFDWDEMTQSYIYAAPSLGSLLCLLLTVRLNEVWGPKLVVGWCMASTALLVALGPVAARTGVWVYIALLFLRGCLGAPVGTGFVILFTAWLPANERTRSAGIAFSATIVGTLLSMFTAGSLMEQYGWTMPAYASAATSLPFLVVWYCLVYDTPLRHPRICPEERAYIVATTNMDYVEVTPPAPWLKIVSSGPIWAHIAVQVAMSWTSFVFGAQLPTYLKNILHFNIQQSSFISALPHLANLVSNVTCSALSQWLRSRRLLGHLTCYRLFNFLATVASAAVIAAISGLGCDSTAIVAVLVVAMALNGSYFGGSFMNNLDLAPNFAGSVSALSSTVTGTISIIAPTIIGAITDQQQTLAAWSKVFYVSAAVSAAPYLVFFALGSVDEQPWNRISKDEEQVPIINAEAEALAVDTSQDC
ncbi:uncharacterized transporter slc-17.2-like [Bacillus rossius redtenbacheri]|uniref:uncharacterized transporter slc-17.2-like n=1 Tax=Bacillus rossius redtenbacheri TaxID=93214 RepID=UPI002FDC9102